MKAIKTEEKAIKVSLDKNDTFNDIRRILNCVTFTKYESVIFETNNVHTSVIHKLRDMFIDKKYTETSNPYDNTVMAFNK